MILNVKIPETAHEIVRQALLEDRADHDITTTFLIGPSDMAMGDVLIKEDAVISGIEIVRMVFKKLDNGSVFRAFYKDGQRVKKNAVIASVKGKTRAILSGERVALNFLGYLSGIATNADSYVRAIYPYKARILDTRKTTPGLRDLEKYAVRCAGAYNHRRDLNEMALVKDNHRIAGAAKRSMYEAIVHLKKKTQKPIEVEVDDLEQFKEALTAGPDMILLDNMSNADMAKAVKIVKGIKHQKRPLLEASGGITLENVRAAARTGVDRISIGSLTHSHRSVDVSLELRACV
jgi:nicotinate-nucleotide pyrophosphorylase (carboxylating)